MDAGIDFIWDNRKKELWGFLGGEFGLNPITRFRRHAGSSCCASTAGLIWNMKSPRQFNGGGAAATFPLSAARLFARLSIFKQVPMYNTMTRLADLSLRRRGWNLQFGISGFSRTGPAFLKIGPGSDFSAEVFGLQQGRRIKNPNLTGLFGNFSNNPAILTRMIERAKRGLPCFEPRCLE